MADDDAAEAAAEAEAAVEEDVVAAADVELDELDEQPAIATTDRATAPETPASKRSRVRRCVRFMATSLRSRGNPEVSGSWPFSEPIVTTWK